LDNAVAESFFSNMKKEELYRHEYKLEREFRGNNNFKAPDAKEQEY